MLWVSKDRVHFYERKVRTVPLMMPLQIGHFLRDGAHSWHTTRWPQGMNTIDTSLSMHTLQVRSSCSLLSCSCNDRPSNRRKCTESVSTYLPLEKQSDALIGWKSYCYFTCNIFCWDILHVVFHWEKKIQKNVTLPNTRPLYVQIIVYQPDSF